MIEIGQLIIDTHLVTYRVLKSGPKTVLFLHGWRSNADVWKEVMYALEKEGYTSYSLNLPGFGGSETPKTTFGVEEYAHIVNEFIKTMTLGQVSIVGHSFGGRIGIYLAATNSSAVGKLVLVDSAGVLVPTIQRKFLKYLSYITRPLFSLRSMQGIRRTLYTLLDAEDYLATPELQRTFVKVISQNLESYLPKISVPTLLLWGANDTDTPLSFAHIFERNIRGSKLIVYEDAGHYCFLDKPGEFVRDLTKFLS